VVRTCSAEETVTAISDASGQRIEILTLWWGLLNNDTDNLSVVNDDSTPPPERFEGVHTELDGRGLLALLLVLGEEILPPCLHDKHVVDRNNVDILDTLTLELLVLLDITRDLVGTRWREAIISLRNRKDVCVLTHAAGTVMITFFPVNLEKLTFSSKELILMSTSGAASPALIGAAATREAKALCAV
jgi:hypothetical protein